MALLYFGVDKSGGACNCPKGTIRLVNIELCKLHRALGRLTLGHEPIQLDIVRAKRC